MVILCPTWQCSRLLFPSYIWRCHVSWPTLWKEIWRCRCISDPRQPTIHPFQHMCCWPNSLAPLYSIGTCLLKYLALSDRCWHILWTTQCQLHWRAIKNPTPPVLTIVAFLLLISDGSRRRQTHKLWLWPLFTSEVRCIANIKFI